MSLFALVKYFVLLITWAIFLLSEYCASQSFEACQKINITRRGDWDYKEYWEPHYGGMAMFLFFTGNGIVIFRLLPGLPTRVVKFLHVLVHLIALVAGVHALYTIRIIRTYKLLKEENSLHRKLSKWYLWLYFNQCVTGLTVFVYMYPNQRLRRMYALVHNFIGVISFKLGCIIIIAKIYSHTDRLNVCKVGEESTYNLYYLTAYSCLILLIVINPHCEWPLVGLI